MTYILIKAIRAYQKISFFLPHSCRFYPSCSCYAIEAINKKGLFVGVLHSLYRVIRCNPLNHGGWDPVK